MTLLLTGHSGPTVSDVFADRSIWAPRVYPASDPPRPSRPKAGVGPSVFKYIVCGHDCVCLMRCKVNPRQNCVSHMRPRQCLAGPKYHFQSRHTNLHMPHYGAHEIVFKAFYNALYSLRCSPPVNWHFPAPSHQKL